MERVKQPMAPRLVKPALSSDDVRRLLAAARSAGENPLRDEALVLFMLDTGARVNEICGPRLAVVTWPQRLAKVHGKGGKERYLPFSALTLKAV